MSHYAKRIVITGIGLTAPNGNSLPEYRKNLLAGKAGIQKFQTRYMDEVLAGVCNFDVNKYQTKKETRRGTRAGSISIYCAHEAIKNARIESSKVDKSKIGIYLGITEHGNVETENEIHNIKQFDYDVKFWTHHHNPRTVANNPAGEVSLNMGISGPHYTIGAACAAGNCGIIQGAQMLLLNEVDMALVGGIAETIHPFGIFASCKSQGALAFHENPHKACRPFDQKRNGIVVSEGGCIYTLERLEDALKRKAYIYGEVVSHAINSDAVDFVIPFGERQAECMELALFRGGISPEQIDILSSHATATPVGDIQEAKAIKKVFGKSSKTYVNNTKSFIGHTMGAAGALELAGNLPSFEEGLVHPTINLDNLDPECDIPLLVIKTPEKIKQVDYILNNSFGMLGINSVVIVKRYKK